MPGVPSSAASTTRTIPGALLSFANIRLALVTQGQHRPHIGFKRPDAEKFGPLKTHRDGEGLCLSGRSCGECRRILGRRLSQRPVMNKDITPPASDVPPLRIGACNAARVDASAARFVVYWMAAQCRANWNFALDRAVDWAKHLRKPLLVVEGLGCENRFASERHHRFILEGMVENARQFAESPLHYFPFLGKPCGRRAKAFRALAQEACLIVADDYPLAVELDPENWAGELTIRLEKVDSHGFIADVCRP